MSPISPNQIENVVAFHGHVCPGIAMGIRIAEAALQTLGPRSTDEELVCIGEADFCAVDAIQYLVGCSIGKGNLILRAWGKKAFTFYRRSDGAAYRVAWRSDYSPDAADREAQIDAILSDRLEDMLTIKAVTMEQPPKAQVMGSVICAECGEEVMASKVHWFAGQPYCVPCYQTEENRRAMPMTSTVG